MLKDLQLKWTNHPDGKYADRQYLDFIISGQSLRDYLGIKSKTGVSPFGFFPSKEEQKRALREFTLRQNTQLSDNRIELYVCEDCGDIGCGAITARIVDRGDRIIWAQFANQSDREQVGERIDVQEIEFNRQDYFKALSVII